MASDKGGGWTEDFFQPVRLLKVSQCGATSPGAACTQGSGYFTEGFLPRGWCGSATSRVRGYSQPQF